MSVGEKKKLAVQKIGSTGFSSALNTHRTNEACSYTVIARLGHVIVNAVICRYSHRLATGLNAVILTRFCTVYWLTKIKCYKSFDSYFFLGGGGGRGRLDFRVFLSNRFPCLWVTLPVKSRNSEVHMFLPHLWLLFLSLTQLCTNCSPPSHFHDLNIECDQKLNEKLQSTF